MIDCLEYRALESLGQAVIHQAYLDATERTDTIDRTYARCFLMGKGIWWRNSLFSWCAVAGCNPDKIMKKSRELWG